MRILVFGRNRAQRSRTSKASRRFALEKHALGELPEMIPTLRDGTLVYIDLTGVGPLQREKILTIIPDNPRILFGILDPTGVVHDVAALFHAGAVDYLGKNTRGGRLSATRVSRVLSYADGGPQEEEVTDEALSVRPASQVDVTDDAWSKIRSGREYEFAILFVEVDGSEELKKRHEPENLSGAMESFRSYVERIASQHGGRTWMWSQFGGLVLFPLRKGDSSAPLCGLRMMLWRIFYDVEESLLPGHLSFHLALSTGTTVYRQRDTGEIISEGINSVFHLGKRYTRPAQFFISNDAMSLVPLKLRFLCVPVGSYEGKRIFRMIPPRPVLIAGDGSGQRKK